jgi:hypothetical protein
MNAKRTVQFHIGDKGFFKSGKILSRKSDLDTLLTADKVTLKITNKKWHNGPGYPSTSYWKRN